MSELPVLYPKTFSDITVISPYGDQNENRAIGSLVADRYILSNTSKSEYIYNLLKQLDGNKSIEELAKQNGVATEKMAKVIGGFGRCGLIQNVPYTSNMEVSRLSINLFSVPCAKLFHFSQKHFRSIVLGIILVFFVSLAVCLFHIPYIFNSVRGTFSIWGGLISMILMVPSFLIHEMFHGLVASRKGLIVQKINFNLYLGLFLMAFVRIPNIYTVPISSRRRILLSGMVGNVLLFVVSRALFVVTKLDIFNYISIAQINIIVVNLTPFQLTDFYFLLSDWLRTPNLRKRFLSTVGTFDFRTLDWKVFTYGLLMLSTLYVSFLYFSLFYWKGLLTLGPFKYIHADVNLVGSPFIFPMIIIAVYLAIIHARYRNA